MLKTKTWALIVGVLLAVSAAAAAFVMLRRPPSQVVQVLQDGVCIREIDLAAVSAPFSFVVEDPHGGSNTVEVEHGRIRISAADCPDQICVQHGWLPEKSTPIVCLPHKLVLKFQGESEFDSATE